MSNLGNYMKRQAIFCEQNDSISKNLYSEYGVKRGLRDEKGQGVLTGLTNISDIKAFEYRDGVKSPCDGELSYRGYNIKDLVTGSKGKGLSIAENFLRLLRPDTKFTELEARVLDIALLLHMEHGGGNNSTFTTRVVTSSGSDTYSVISAAMSSLKGKKHGGANLMVMNMMDDIKSHVKDYEDEEEIASYLSKILKKEAFDQKGLIYGMGHAVYSISDPRERVFKGFVEQLARDKGREKDMTLYNNIEKIAPKLIAKQRQIFKGVSPNIDFYSGFVYDMLNIPRELYTPLFAIARIAGWSAHRLEELITTDKIIRPAYKSLVSKKEYIEREER